MTFKINTNHSHFFSSVFTESLSPLQLSWISFSIKIPMAFGTAKLESLQGIEYLVQFHVA